jgi:hypothetical protein
MAMPRVIVIMGAPDGHLEFIAHAKHIASCLADVALFPSPTPPLSVLEGAIALLDAAQLAVARHAVGAAADRNFKRNVVHDYLRQECAYVQHRIEGLPREQALEIVAQSGFAVKGDTGYARAAFRVKQGKTSDSVELFVRAEKTRATYYWQYSKDGTTWVSAKDTQIAKTTISNLEVGVRYWFRYRSSTSAAERDFCDPVAFVVG